MRVCFVTSSTNVKREVAIRRNQKCGFPPRSSYGKDVIQNRKKTMEAR